MGGGLQMEVPADSGAIGLTYGPRDELKNPDGNKRYRFEDYFGAKLYAIHTQLAVETGGSSDDPLPPNMFQIGDIIEAQGNRFVIVDDARNQQLRAFPNGAKFLNPALHPDPYKNALICIRLDEVLQGSKVPPLAVPANGYTYAIHRQPMGNERTDASPKERIITSGEPPFQMPAGIAIDLVSSGFEADEMQTIFEFARPEDNSSNKLKYTTGIMFSPNGGVDSVWINGQRYTDASRVFFLLGRVENGNPDFDTTYDFSRSGGGVTQGEVSDTEFKDRQSKVNWLNPDSRWLFINGNDGRLTVSQNALVDPRTHDDPGTRTGTALEMREAQIEAAHELAHGGGGQ